MMNVWGWLNSNSGALQSIAALVATVLTVLTIVVLIVTWRAIKIQAEAARSLTRVASEQTKAARDAAASTKRQADLLAEQIEMSMAPLLVAEPDDSNPVTSHRSYRLFNRGQGIAFQVYYWEGGLEARGSATLHYVRPSTLAPGTFAQITIHERQPSWVAQYKGIDDKQRWLKVYLDSHRGQEHIICVGGSEKHLQ